MFSVLVTWRCEAGLIRGTIASSVEPAVTFAPCVVCCFCVLSDAILFVLYVVSGFIYRGFGSFRSRVPSHPHTELGFR